MQFEQNEIEHYEFGSQLWVGENDPVLVAGVNDEVFWDSFLGAKGGRGFSRLDCEENRATLLGKYARLFPGQPIVRSQLSTIWYQLMIAHSPDFVDPKAEPEDTRPRDANGNLLSAEAVRNQEYLAWMTGKSDFDIRQRRTADAGFSRFHTAMNQAQLRSDDPVANVNYQNNVRTDNGNANQALRDWAAEYQRTPVAEIKRKLSPATNPAGFQEFNKNFQAAMSAGLV